MSCSFGITFVSCNIELLIYPLLRAWTLGGSGLKVENNRLTLEADGLQFVIHASLIHAFGAKVFVAIIGTFGASSRLYGTWQVRHCREHMCTHHNCIYHFSHIVYIAMSYTSYALHQQAVSTVHLNLYILHLHPHSHHNHLGNPHDYHPVYIVSIPNYYR